MDDRIIVNDAHGFEVQFRRLMLGINTSMPAIIRKFYPETQTCDAQPAIKMQYTVGDKAEFLDMPLCLNVPVCLPYSQTSGLCVTLPVKAGDECLLIFSQRAIDNFVEFGGLQPPILTKNQAATQGRSFDMTDAVCIPGIISGPNAITNYNNNAVEIRNRTRSVFVSLSESQIDIGGYVKTNNHIEVGTGASGVFNDHLGKKITVKNGIVVGIE